MRPIAECEACTVGMYATCGPWPEDSPACLHGHAQVLVHYPLDYDRGRYRAHEGMIGVDPLIVPMLQPLWAAGVRTWVSCQGGYPHGDGYVAYHHEDHEAALSTLKGLGIEPTKIDLDTEGRHPGGRLAFYPIANG